MVDWIVLLSPLLVLGALMLVGFAGCSFTPGRVPPTIQDLILRARVPTTLMVRNVVFRWTPPGGVEFTQILTLPSPTGFDGADSVYGHQLQMPPAGAWISSCALTVRDETGAAQATASGSFNLEGELATPTASFQAEGAPATGFLLVFVGVS